MGRISICKALAKWNEVDPFLKRLVTGDKKWFTYDSIEGKRSWSQRGEAAQSLTKQGQTARKSPKNLALDNLAIRIARPHPCSSKTPTCRPFSRGSQNDTEQDIISDAEIIVAVSLNEKIPGNDKGVKAVDTVKTPKRSHREELKAVETTLQYFEQGASVMYLLFFRRLRDEAAKRRGQYGRQQTLLCISLKKKVAGFEKPTT
ncbi:hypothetical protein TNCV_4586051 [Trichonephila clavipes]|nr:hypothetical protein TNCV_4586051 [Trichonephila clavipes]